ncbi:MAG: DUF1501 domain-containing protein [Alphaproteobacteria bacterium]|nr:DUF1501 domain-containing protein [Alphaproteobacteria bacterium]
MTHRRDFLKGSLASLIALGAPGIPGAFANPLVTGRLKFVFVFAGGGWDPTRVFATEFSNGNVDMEPRAALRSFGDLSIVSHPDRPSVTSFFDAHAQQALVLNGVMVRSIAHEICTLISLTGTTASGAPDWPAILAAGKQSEYILPHLVLSGPSFPGDLGVAVARTGVNGQLDALLSGDALERNDIGYLGPSSPAEGVMDRYLVRRAAARADAARSALDAQLNQDLVASLDQAQRLKEMQYVMDLSGGADLASQGVVAAEALSMGVSRCVTLDYSAGWDTHADNDATQSPLWENLFNGLGQLMSLLQSTPGEEEATLAEETVLVVMSEMGRTPALNALNGKDHWPYTSVLMVGPGLTGGRVVGGYDANYYGLPVDPISGEVDEASGQILSAEAVGATLLAMSDIDPNDYVSGVSPIMGVLE